MLPSFTRQVLIFCILFLGHYQTKAQQTVPTCGTNDTTVASYLTKFIQTRDLTAARTMAGEKLEYRLALDISYQTYQLYNGDKEKLTKTAYQFIQKASEIFEREINVKLVVTSILIWDKPEPYVLTDDYHYFSNVLDYWTNNRFEERDAVVSLSCRFGWFYGGFRMASSNFPTPNDPNLSVDLLAHELGHTLGSPHTHYCGWPGGPIDRCISVEGANSECQDGFTEFTIGSLMSYCRGILSFHPLCRNLMRDFAEGRVFENFQLNKLNIVPDIPGNLVVQGGISDTPAFKWDATKNTDKFRIQVSKERSFSQPAEDTLVNQPFFQAAGYGEGNCYIRVRAENVSGQSQWSEILNISIPAFSNSSLPPQFLDLSFLNNSVIQGHFRTFDGMDAYQIRLIGIFTNTTVVIDKNAATSRTQSFEISLPDGINQNFNVQLRVRRNNIWSSWSESVSMAGPWLSFLDYTTNLSNTSTKPFIDSRLSYYDYPLTTPLRQIIEVSETSDFKNIVFTDSVETHQINSWHTHRTTFVPELKEKTSYFVRFRVKWSFDKYSGWTTYQLNTGNADLRFTHLGTPSDNLHYNDGTYELKTGFHVSGNKLYVFDQNRGYYVTDNLKNWEKFTSFSTGGKMANPVRNLAEKNGKVYAFGPGLLSIKDNNNYVNQYVDIFSYRTESLTVTQDNGIFLPTDKYGVGNFNGSAWRFYNQDVLLSNTSRVVTADSEGRVWTIMQGGSVWSYQNDIWRSEAHLQQWPNISGMAMDNDNTLYAFGDAGLLRLDRTGQKWDNIEALSGFSIKRIVFDKENRMWLAAYKFSEPGYSTALIKYKDQKVTIYSDGLNITNDPFDIAVYQDQLLILTNSGEIVSFDESRILQLDFNTTYCAGDELTISVASNSTFAKENKTTFQLRNVLNQETNILQALRQDGNKITIKLPVAPTTGKYNLTMLTTAPEIISNVSSDFTIYPLPEAQITTSQNSLFKTTLKTKAGAGLTYQWHLDNADIPNANDATLLPAQTGNYSVTVTNEAGCKTKSAPVAVEAESPAEVTLLQNMPNPILSSSEILFYLPSDQQIQLELFNNRGQRLKVLKQGEFRQGWHSVYVDGDQLAKGVYIYKLTAGTVSKSLKMLK